MNEQIKEVAKDVIDGSFGDKEAQERAAERVKRLFGKSAKIEFYEEEGAIQGG